MIAVLSRLIVIALAFALTGCAADLAALAKDSATACGTLTTVYGTLKFARSNLASGDVTCNDLTMHSTSGVTVPITVTPMFRMEQPVMK